MDIHDVKLKMRVAERVCGDGVEGRVLVLAVVE